MSNSVNKSNLSNKIREPDSQFEEYSADDILRLSHLCLNNNDKDCQNTSIKLFQRFVRWRRTKPYRYITGISKIQLLSYNEYNNILQFIYQHSLVKNVSEQ